MAKLTCAHQAFDILRAFWPQDSTTGSFKRSKLPNKNGLRREWWLNGWSYRDKPSERDVAYLAGYDEICRRADKPMWASGLPLDDVIEYDKSVIAALLTHQCVELEGDAFRITEKGRHLIATLQRPPLP